MNWAEFIPSPNDVYVQRERDEKNEDISQWSVSVSAAKAQGMMRLRCEILG
jgi:hypothetical protein